ncbi:FAD-dependent oxidoreductase [Virgisporangium ochraceum]|uniref:FAD-dependent oxidoreductase n=1 Tax=Virgisporangium ochraceum TaxID=65505 RepID=UPI0019406C99|nr:FAD-dependent oxidoreductase [Virgisporangium ochraceum]
MFEGRSRRCRKRVVIAGLGDSGVLTAIHLAGHVDVVGISTKPAWVSGKELGTRISRPDDWARDYWVAFDRFRRLAGMRTVHGVLTGVDLDRRRVFVRGADGTTGTEDYDALVIATGVTSGFWRRPTVQSADEIGEELRRVHDQVAAAGCVAVIGGGVTAVNAAVNVAVTWPDKRVELYFPGERPLLTHHARVWNRVRRRLARLGVELHPRHRAVVPEGFRCDRITAGPVRWHTGQPDTEADAVLWAIGRVTPNTGWLPPELLDERGFVRVTPQLRVPGRPDMYAIGDVAATDPLRSSARNRADRLLAGNIRAGFAGRPLRRFRARTVQWGSVLGVQPDGLEIYAPNGRAFRFPAWSIEPVLQPWIVRRGIYRGIRDPAP